MLFQFKICFYCEDVPMKALSSSSFNIKGTDRNREKGRGREGGGGDRRELLSVCWWANSISGNTMEPEADFQKGNCHSGEQYGTCLVSSSAVLLCSGCTWGRRLEPEERTALCWGPVMGRIESETVMCLKCIEMKIGQALTAAFGIHSYKHSIGFDQIEGAHRWGSSELTQTMMLLPRWQTKNPLSPRNTATSPWALNPNQTPCHTPLHMHPSSTSIISWSYTLWAALHAVLQLQSCLHRLKTKPIWQQLNTLKNTPTCEQCRASKTCNPINSHTHTLSHKHLYSPWLHGITTYLT